MTVYHGLNVHDYTVNICISTIFLFIVKLFFLSHLHICYLFLYYLISITAEFFLPYGNLFISGKCWIFIKPNTGLSLRTDPICKKCECKVAAKAGNSSNIFTHIEVQMKVCRIIKL